MFPFEKTGVYLGKRQLSSFPQPLLLLLPFLYLFKESTAPLKNDLKSLKNFFLSAIFPDEIKKQLT